MSEPNTLRNEPAQALTVRTHVGVIDLGTNAIRVQVSRVFFDGSFKVIHDEREPVPLGDEVFRSGALAEAAIDLALDTLERFCESARRHGATRIRAVATSAVREASNGLAFVEEVEQATGLKLEVISGAQEASLIARGVLSGLESQRGRIALVDIGGGSTEITLVEQGRIEFCGSVPIGSARMTEMFCRTDPLGGEDEQGLRAHVREALGASLPPAAAPCPTVIGSAGTIGAVANFIRKRPSQPRNRSRARATFSMRDLQRASATLREMDLATRRRTPGIEERRGEIIVAGSIILEEICARLGARSVRMVRRGLRDGLMLDEIERLGPELRLPQGPPILPPPPTSFRRKRRPSV